MFQGNYGKDNNASKQKLKNNAICLFVPSQK